MKRTSYIIGLFLLGLILFQIFKNHTVTIYLTVGNSNGKSLNRHVRLEIDDNVLFQDSLKNHIFIAEIIHVELRSGFHSLEVYSNGKNIAIQERFFILFDQHLVLEYFDDCIENKPCYKVRNKLRRYYID